MPEVRYTLQRLFDKICTKLFVRRAKTLCKQTVAFLTPRNPEAVRDCLNSGLTNSKPAALPMPALSGFWSMVRRLVKAISGSSACQKNQNNVRCWSSGVDCLHARILCKCTMRELDGA
jgi:hypothetical protein